MLNSFCVYSTVLVRSVQIFLLESACLTDPFPLSMMSSTTTIFANVSRPQIYNVASSSRSVWSATHWSEPPSSVSSATQPLTTWSHRSPRKSSRSSPSPHDSIRCFSSSRSRLDHYRTLGVDRSTSMKDIKNQFYALSKKYHPDVNRDDEGAKKKFQEVSEAWSILGDEKSK